MKSFPLHIKVLIAVVVIAISGWFLFGNQLELGKPVVKFDQDIKAIGRQKSFTIIFSDSKSGISRITAEIIQDNKGQILADKQIPVKETPQETLPLTVKTADLRLHDGPAVLKVTATDYSLFKNQAVLMQPVQIDTVPPMINLDKNIN